MSLFIKKLPALNLLAWIPADGRRWWMTGLAVAALGCSTPVAAPKAEAPAEFLEENAEGDVAAPSARSSQSTKQGAPLTRPLPSPSKATVAPSSPVAKAPLAGPPRALAIAPAQLKAVQSCREVVNRFTPVYGALFAQLPAGTYAKTNTTIEQLSFATASQCDDPNLRKALMSAAIDVVNNHSSRVGVILPLTGAYAKQATYVVNGLRAAFEESGVSFDKSVVLKDSGGQPSGVASRLAELVFKDRVTMVIGGFEREAAVTLVEWSERLLLPVMILHRERELINPAKYAYSVYPDEERLASTLAVASRERNFKRIALLKPNSGRANKVTDYFKAAVLASGGKVVAELTYTSNHFESMQAAAKALLHTEMRGREQEYRQAYQAAKAAAQAEGVAFNAKMVVLKPIVDIDAVFIPDDFRSVRYFAKIFKFNQVDKLALIGNHEWRSPALLEPYDEFLNGSIFGDFIGSYKKLPAAISAPTLAASPFFVDPQMVQAVDFQVVGYRAGRIAKAIVLQPGLSRRAIPRAMARLKGDQVGLPINGPIFDKDRHSYWPTYVFSIAPHELRLLHAMASGKAAAQSAVQAPVAGKSCANPADRRCLAGGTGARLIPSNAGPRL